MSASVSKSDRAAIAAERKARFKALVQTVSAMSEDDRAELARRMPIVNTAGHALSPFNQCLIMRQAAGPATIVGGFRQWLVAGRCVAAGQHGYMIWVPIGRKKTAKSEEGDADRVSFIAGTVFDISQTVELGAEKGGAA